jgi:cyclohexadienyl dehydratase
MRCVLSIVVLLVLSRAPVCESAEARFLDESQAVATVLDEMDQRLAVMPDVAAYKWSKHAAISDPPREQAVIQSAVERAAALGLDAAGIRKVFELQIRLAREVQAHLHEQWSKAGFDATRPIPSLEKDIRPKLDRITPDLLSAIYLAAADLQRTDFVATHTDLANEHLKTEGWTDDSRREALEALNAIRSMPIPTLDRIRAAGVLRIGTTGDYAPFSLLSGETLTGSDIELGQSLAAKLNVKPIFVRTTWGHLTDDLSIYKFDIAMGGVSVTPAREKIAAFSTPYSSGGKTIVSRCKDAKRFASLKAVDRSGVRVIVNPGGTNEQFARENVHHASVQVFPDNRAIFDEIRAGHADVMITDDVEVELQIHRHSDLCRPYRGVFTHSDKAILMPRDAQLVAAVNDWLAPEVQAGKPARLIEQFLQSPP